MKIVIYKRAEELFSLIELLGPLQSICCELRQVLSHTLPLISLPFSFLFLKTFTCLFKYSLPVIVRESATSEVELMGTMVRWEILVKTFFFFLHYLDLFFFSFFVLFCG